MDGMINIYKEKDYTSHDVVARLRGILKQKKIGHTGTLDPQAEGVLPVCLGKGTKLCDMLADRTKTYEVVMRLGVTTDTEDMTGTVLSESTVTVDAFQIANAVQSFCGNYAQVPPMYSALKVNGKKLYELAREGKVIERKPRNVEIFKIEITDIQIPLVKMRVDCSKGTYVRSLCRDIGEKLGCGAAMESLLRTRVGDFLLKDALTLAQIEELVQEGQVFQKVRAVDAAFLQYPQIVLPEKLEKRADNGNPFYAGEIERTDAVRIRVYKTDGTFIGLYQYKEKEKRFVPEKLFFVEGSKHALLS